jgi:hypothetical protein
MVKDPEWFNVGEIITGGGAGAYQVAYLSGFTRQASLSCPNSRFV